MVEQLAARGALEKLPPAIRDAPELRLGLGLYWSAFWDLDSCRAIGMGEGPIPWLAIDAYASARGLDAEQRDDLQFFIAAMDRVYLQHLSEKREKESKRGSKAQPGKLRAPHPKGGGGRRARSQ